MRNISKEDFVIWNTEKDQPTWGYDTVYHYTTIMEMVNGMFRLEPYEALICVASLSISEQIKFSEAIEKTK